MSGDTQHATIPINEWDSICRETLGVTIIIGRKSATIIRLKQWCGFGRAERIVHSNPNSSCPDVILNLQLL